MRVVFDAAGTALGGDILGAVIPGPTGVAPAIRSGGKNLDDLVARVQRKYPKKAGKIEAHHVDLKYVGGDPNGQTVDIDGAYHQEITNKFRELWPYGQGRRPSADELQRLKDEVYSDLPLPPPGSR